MILILFPVTLLTINTFKIGLPSITSGSEEVWADQGLQEMSACQDNI